MTKIKKIVLASLLLASLIVASRFLSVKTPILVVSFSFVPIMLSAILLGPKWTALIAGLGDLIGALLFPFGSYFPGWTLSACLTGAIHGLFLYKGGKNANISDSKYVLRLILSCICVLGFVSVGINSIWLIITSERAATVILSTRAISAACMLPIQVITMFVLEKLLRKPIEKYLR